MGRRTLAPVIALNLVLAVGILAYNRPVFPLVLTEMDARLALVAFAAVSLLASATALARWRVAAWIVWAAFGVDFALCVLLMVFLLTFKITRLI